MTSGIEHLESRRLLATLTPDAAWADDGYVSRRADSEFVASTRAGVLTIDGLFNNRHLARYAADGTPDRNFADIPVYPEARVAADTRGRIYVVRNGDDGRPTLARYAPDGRPDAAWAGGGRVSLGSLSNYVYYDERFDLLRVTLAADGSVFVHVTYDDSVNDGGDYLYGGRHDVVFKFSDTGAADTAFAENGVIDFSSENAGDVDFVWTGVQADGHVVLVQASGAGGAFVTRYRKDGKIDKAYRRNAAASPVAGELTSESIALDPHGQLTIGERLAVPRPGTKKIDYAYGVRRFGADGRPDTAFGTGGVAAVAPATADGVAGTVLPQRDGKLIVQFGLQVFRLKPSGARDQNFALGGVAGVYCAAPAVVGQLPDGSLLAAATVNLPRGFFETIAKLAPNAPAAQGRSGTLYLYGEQGDDTLNVYSAGRGKGAAVDLNGQRLGVFTGVTAVVADLIAGNNVYVNEFNDVPQTVYAGDGDDRIVTGDGDDRVYANGGDDTVQSNGGFDRLDLGTGNGTVDAGSGGGEIGLLPLKPEHVSVRGAGGDWSVACYGGHADVVLTGRTADLDFAGALSSSLDVRTTNGATIHGGRGNDSIVTGDGNDSIRPDAGEDTVVSGAGNDTVVSDDELYGEPSYPLDDRYDLGPGNDVAVDSFGDNTIVGGDGDDSIRTGNGEDSLSGGAGRDTLRGGQGDDTLLGNGGRDRLFGYEGDDLLDGGANDDTLYAGGGDDTLEGGSGDNVLR